MKKASTMILVLLTMMLSNEQVHGQAQTTKAEAPLPDDKDLLARHLQDLLAKNQVMEDRIAELKAKLDQGELDDKQRMVVEREFSKLISEKKFFISQIAEARSMLDPEPVEARLFKLQRTNAGAAADVISQILEAEDFSVSVAQATNTLVVRGGQSTVAEIAALVEKLEAQEAAETASGRHLSVFALRARDSTEVSALLSEMFPLTSIWGDSKSNRVFVRGEQQQTAEVTRILSEIDQPAKLLSVSVDFIEATAGSKAQGELPPYLEPVGSAIRQAGMGNLRLLAHMMSRVEDGQDFHAEGYVSRTISGSDETAQEFDVMTAGRLHAVEGGSAVHIKITATIDQLAARGKKSEIFDASTSAVVPLGDYMVLGAMPTRMEQADTIVMVIRVTAD